MLRPCLLVVFGACAASRALGGALAAPQESQGDEADAENELVELRITLVRGSSVVIDRGSADLVRVGDMVFFRPREGGLHPGLVSQVDERSATVELQGAGFPATAGVRGFVRIPSSRRAPAASPRRTERSEDADREPSQWSNPDEEWRQGQPLLARVRPVRPEERPRSYSGRWYTTLDQIRSTEDDRRDAFYRLGGSLRVDNLTGDGDRLYFDGEVNYRETDVPDDEDQTARRLRLDRLSYSWGGTRFAPTRVELGRFLHYGMPEFGVLDGAEWGTRTSGGDRFGFAAGYLPEPDLNYETGDDFTVSAYYRWVYDESERLSAALGYQKSWHDGDADRDLAVLNLSYLPGQSWSFVGSAWVDFYTSGDALKDNGPELTQALANLTHTWSPTTSVGLRYTHIAFPQIDRHEFRPPAPGDIADAHVDRLAGFLRSDFSRSLRVLADAGVWSDQDDNGVNAELGLEFVDLWFDGAVVGAAVFGLNGKFSDAVGARGWLRRWSASGGWSLEYELANNDIVGFSSQNDDLPQHRIRAQWDYVSTSNWSLRLQLDTLFWDDESSVAAGLHVNRTF